MTRLRVVGAPAPSTSLAGRQLLRELARMEQPLRDAMLEKDVALARDDVDAAVSCARRLLHIALYLRDPANAAGGEL